jgi:hypothetical protein
MEPITYGTTGLSFGANAESGIIVISVSRTADSRMKEVLDNSGNIIGVGHYAFKADYRISATYLTTGTGLAVATVGSTVTISNGSNLNGVSGGIYVVNSAATNYSNEDFVKFDLAITQYPAI